MRMISILALAVLTGCFGGDKDDTGAGGGPGPDADGDGYSKRDGDCDDADATVNPGATETWYDGIDQNCDRNDDDQDGDGVGVDNDCDDTDASRNPRADDVACDGIDQDCDGTDSTAGGTVGYADGDSDGYGDRDAPARYCGDTPPAGVSATGDDCDDTNADVHPGADEVCNEADDNCDGRVDNQPVDGGTYYPDADLDGFGDETSGVTACTAPPGFIEDGSDCNDRIAGVNPDADETCNGVDDNCDGTADEGLPTSTWYPDADNDTYGEMGAGVDACSQPRGYVADGTDCDDGDRTTHPGARELCDSLDNDCDGAVDDGVTISTFYIDSDGDGFGDPSATVEDCSPPEGYSTNSADCDDTNASVYPRADEYCNGIDDNCDGAIDVNAVDVITWYTDADADGYGTGLGVLSCDTLDGYALVNGDCADDNADVNPGAVELCDERDNNCDSLVDNGAGDSWYRDDDGDGYGLSTLSPVVSCTAPDGFVTLDGDCADDNADVNPGAPEICNGVDDNCNSLTDEDGTGTTWYVDMDSDGYGYDLSAVSSCTSPGVGYITTGGDCDDADGTVNPGAAEADDLADNDCDGYVDEDFIGFGDLVISEINRQPLVGGTRVAPAAEWFEVYNPSATRTIDLSNVYFVRYTSDLDIQGFRVAAGSGLLIGPGEYVTMCKTSDYEGVSGVPYSLACDYLWGDASQPPTYEGPYHTNTFAFGATDDTFGIYMAGNLDTGTLLDDVTWANDVSGGYWPHDQGRTLTLDPDSLDATDNDSVGVWCSTPTSLSFGWWSDGTNMEYGTPGAAGYNCVL